MCYVYNIIRHYEHIRENIDDLHVAMLIGIKFVKTLIQTFLAQNLLTHDLLKNDLHRLC